MSLWTLRMQFWQPCRIRSDQRPIFFCLRSENDEISTLFSGEISQLKLFFWTRWMQFWLPRGIFFDQTPNTFRSWSKNGENFRIFSEELSFLKITISTRRMQFWQHPEILSNRSRKFFAQSPKSMKNLNISRITASLKKLLSHKWNAVWQTRRNLFDKKLYFLGSGSEIDEQLRLYSEEVSFFKMFFWTRRMHMWHPRRGNFHRRPEIFRSRSEKDFKNF